MTGRLTSGTRWCWKESELTVHYFPGQTLYHQALLVRKDGGKSVCFIGDSFTPSGIDDYCLQNRNLLRADAGFLNLTFATGTGFERNWGCRPSKSLVKRSF